MILGVFSGPVNRAKESLGNDIGCVFRVCEQGQRESLGNDIGCVFRALGCGQCATASQLR